MLDSNQNNEIYSSTINLVEQLKLPFIQILKQLELSSINNQYSNLRNIEISA